MKKTLLCLSLAVVSAGLIAFKPGNASAEAADAQKQPGAKSYSIVKVHANPDWTSIPELAADNILWEPDSGIRAFGQLCYDDSYLYVHLRAVEKEIRATFTAPLSPVYQDSCLEFFFKPDDGDRYFNFEINPNGCLYIECGHDRNDRFILYRSDMQERFNIRTERTENGWEVYYQIPLDFIRLFYPDFVFSGILKANVYKCGDKTDNPHYLSWNPITSEKPDFHRPEDFGIMIFES